MKISCIVAVAQDRVIGRNNEMPWHLPADLAYFKQTTINHHIILGRKNYVAIGKPLPKRTNIIVTRDKNFSCSNCVVKHSIEEALYFAEKNGEKEAFIIGGGTIYEQSIHLWDKLYLTEIDLKVEGDVFFPELDWKQWDLVSEVYHQKDDKNPNDYAFKVFNRVLR